MPHSASPVIVVSHRRSGTHLALDLLHHNFEYALPYASLKALDARCETAHKAAAIARVTATSELYKAHCHADFGSYYADPRVASLLDDRIRDSHIVYVMRDAKDTLTSLFFHARRNGETRARDANEFVREPASDRVPKTLRGLNRAEYCEYHRRSWYAASIKLRILIIRYERLIGDYRAVVNEVGSFVGRSPKGTTVDVRRAATNAPGASSSIRSTAVDFRRGIVGDYANYLNISTAAYVDQIQQRMSLTTEKAQ